MKALMWKELRENRMKIIIGCVLLSVIGAAVSIAYRFLEGGIPGMGQIPPEYADLIKKFLPDFSNVNAYLYSQWFSKNLQQVGAILAIVLLGSAVAGERELHTAIFLFSRPVSRGMILAAKVIVLFGGLVLAVLVSTGGAVLGAHRRQGAPVCICAGCDAAQCCRAYCICVTCDIALSARAGPRESDALLRGNPYRSFGRGPVQAPPLAEPAGVVRKPKPHRTPRTTARAHCGRRGSECLHAGDFVLHTAAAGVLARLSFVSRRPRCCSSGPFSVSAIPACGFAYNEH